MIDLLEEDTDLALRIGPLQDSSLRSRPLGRSALRILASPSYLDAKGHPAGVAALLGTMACSGSINPTR